MRHVPAGRLNGVHAEPGTVLGPKSITREFVVVLDNDDRGVTVGYARAEEINAVLIADLPDGPRSVTEAHILRGYQYPERLRLAQLFGGHPSAFARGRTG